MLSSSNFKYFKMSCLRRQHDQGRIMSFYEHGKALKLERTNLGHVPG